jgi:hypothetical protein
VIKSKRIRWARHVARMGEMRNEYRILEGESELEGYRPRWEGILNNQDVRMLTMFI